MNNFSALDSRNRRNLLAHGMNAFSPPFHKNYSTDTTAEMKTSYGDSLFINPMHMILEPYKKDLVDSVMGSQDTKPTMAAETKDFSKQPPKVAARSDYYPSLGGIASFFSGVLNVMGGMFQKRAHSPVQYYDCCEHQQMAPARGWQPAKHEDQNKNGRAAADEFAELSSDMNEEFRSIAAHCEDKINRVRLLLTSNTVQRTVRPRRPKRAFHEAGSIEELYEDAFTPEDFISLANETFLEYCSPYNHHNEELHEVDAPKVKTETKPVESTDIVQSLPPTDIGESKSIPDDKIVESVDSKREVVSSCEDKVNKLKALLQCRRQKGNLDKKSDLSINCSLPTCTSIPDVNTCKETENQPEVIFSKEIEIPNTPDSANVLDPSSYFDEVTGRFYSSSATDSEDSFQIVFSDSPRNSRKRIPSDCESEDSFIVFEETPDGCYTSTDVFGDETINQTLTDSEDSDSDCDEFDSGVSTITLSNTLSRTFGDLTDGSLYDDSEDVVDCAFRSGAVIPREQVHPEANEHIQNKDCKGGVLLDEAKKREKKKLPAKKVCFSEQPPKVHVMRVWAFAARQARAGHWERYARDRDRFKRRIADVEVAISWVLKPQHRSRVMFQRFMPWWNAQKRKELAEKKQREGEERLKREKEEAERVERERLRNEEDRNEHNEESSIKIEGERVSDLDTGGNVNKVTGNQMDLDKLISVLRIVENTLGIKLLEKMNLSTDTVDRYPGKKLNGVINTNSKVDAYMNGYVMDNQTILKNKLIDHPMSVKTDCDKTKFIESEVIVNGDVKGSVLRNGVDKAACNMLCYKQEQAL